MSAQSGTTSLILVSGLSLALCPLEKVSLVMTRPAAIAVKSFEFDAILKSVCQEVSKGFRICSTARTHSHRLSPRYLGHLQTLSQTYLVPILHRLSAAQSQSQPRGFPNPVVTDRSREPAPGRRHCTLASGRCVRRGLERAGDPVSRVVGSAFEGCPGKC